MLSTSASENQTLRLLTEDNSEEKNANDSMDVDSPLKIEDETSSPLSSVNKSAVGKPAPPTSNVIHTPDGKIIVETLDTPALRRQKSMARKAARLRLAAGTDATASSSAGPSAIRSVSSSLTDLDVDGDEDGELPSRSQSRVASSSTAKKDPADVVLADGEFLEGGTLGTYVGIIRYCAEELILLQFGPKLVSLNLLILNIP